MRVSLRVSMMLLVAALNVAVFASGLVWLNDTLRRHQDVQDLRDEEFSDLLAERVQYRVDPSGALDAAGILKWAHWGQFEDAIIVRVPALEQPYRPQATYLNPLGSSHRPADFPVERIMEDIRNAVSDGRRTSNERGMVAPVYGAEGGVWGGCWLRPRERPGAGRLVRRVFPWFVVSTLVLTGLTFSSLRRFVLDPVRELARGVRRIAGGDMEFRVDIPRSRNEISDLVRGFNAMADEVEGFSGRLQHEVEVATRKARRAEAAAMTQRRLAATGALAAGIAHEINNPLGGMLNALEVLERDDLDPQKRAQYLALLKQGLERIGTTVGQVLHLAPRETRTEPVQLAQPIGDALGLVRHRARQQGVEIELVGDAGRAPYEGVETLAIWDGLPPVIGQANDLGQAVLNLLVNSLDALEEGAGGGRIEVTLTRERTADSDELRLVVRDDGPGMDPERLQRAPDLFYTTKDTGKGTGMGLAIAHNVVDNHGGRVLLASREGEGFQVDVLMPVARLEAPRGTEPGPGDSGGARGARSGDGPEDRP